MTPRRLLWAGAVVCLGLAAFQAPPGYESLLSVATPMRDGVRLSANVFHPLGKGPLPVLLVRTAYNKGKDLLAGYRTFTDHGYAVVVQDVRGRYGSDGVFGRLSQERLDGWDTIEWIARQPWSNGKVGMLGGSYLGMVQWEAALENNSHLKAIFPVVAGADEYRDRFYSPGGALKLGHRLLWMAENLRAPGFERPPFEKFTNHLPLRNADAAATGRRVDFYQQVLDHPVYDAHWRGRSILERAASIRVPAFSVGGWYDNYVQGDLELFAARQKAGRPHRALIGPWGHDMSVKFAGADFGPDAHANVRRLQLEWFDRWLKEKPAAEADVAPPPVRIFVMGANAWRDETEWPLARARYTSFFLDAKGLLRETNPRRSEPDRFTYDPRHPVPTQGGAVCCNPKLFPYGPMDQRALEQRADVLVYTTAPLKRDLEVTGPVRAVLSVSTDAPDTDFTAKLIDVDPAGRAINLCDGILRLRYRESIEKVSPPAQPDKVYQVTIDAGVTSNVFGAGHRIRLEISSSNFPRFDRNPNTGRPVAEESQLRIAHQTVYHELHRPSYLWLPVIPAARSALR